MNEVASGGEAQKTLELNTLIGKLWIQPILAQRLVLSLLTGGRPGNLAIPGRANLIRWFYDLMR